MGVAMASLVLIFHSPCNQTHEGQREGQGAEIGGKKLNLVCRGCCSYWHQPIFSAKCVLAICLAARGPGKQQAAYPSRNLLRDPPSPGREAPWGRRRRRRQGISKQISAWINSLLLPWPAGGQADCKNALSQECTLVPV